MNYTKTYQAIKRLYQELQKPIAFIALFIAGIAPLTDSTELQYSALIALSFIILILLFDLHDNIQKEENISYPNFMLASSHVEKHIEMIAKKHDELFIQWLGTAMDLGVPFIKDNIIPTIVSANSNCKINIEVAMLSDDWRDIDRVNSDWKHESKLYYDLMMNYVANTNKGLHNINVFRYEHMPYFTGILINEEILFIAFCSWNDDGKYYVGRNDQYTFFDSNNKNLKQFKLWFDYCKANGKTKKA